MIPIMRPSLPPLEDLVRLLEKIWDSKMLSNFGPYSQQLEKAVADKVKVPFVKAVVSADIGLIITLKALDLPPGAPCFISDFTFNSTINAALWAGLRPVLVDIDDKTFNMDPASLAGAIEQHPARGVVLATHVFGNPCDSSELSRVADKNGSYLVFDAAHALGSQREGVPAGGLGDAEVFSLSGTKVVTSGEGGLIATRHDWLADKINYLRAYGFQNDYISKMQGLNGKISEIHCALGLLTFDILEQSVTRRAQVVESYKARLGDLVGWQHVRPVDRSTFKDICVVLGSNRDRVEEALTGADVQTKRYFVPLHTMPIYASYNGPTENLRSDEVHAATLCLPAFSEITEEEIELICGTIEKAVS